MPAKRKEPARNGRHPAERGFDQCADEYLRGRATYPPEAVIEIVQLLGTPPDELVLDVGAGTGILSRLLAERGLHVVAVDQSASMLSHVAREIPSVVASASSMPFINECFGGIVAATSFHWFANEAALSELHRVLFPGRQLVLTWNDVDPSIEFVRRHLELMDVYVGATPRFRTMEWRRVIDSFRRFECVHEHHVQNPTLMDRSRFLARVLSTSFVATLDHKERQRVIEAEEELLGGMPEEFEYPYVTRTFAFRKSGG